MKRLLVIGHNWPQPTTTAAGQHMVQLIAALQNIGYTITFATTAAKTNYSKDLKQLGVQEVTIQLNHSSFDDFIKNLNPEVVLFDRFMVEEQFGWRVMEHSPNALRILNTEDLHSLRESREIAHKSGAEFEISKWFTLDKTKRELASIYRSDLTILVSTFEMQLLQQRIAIDIKYVVHLPFMLDKIDVKTKEEWPTFEVRQNFITYGNGKHTPNIASFKLLKETLWPEIRKELPEAKLYIYGAYLPQQVKEMNNPKDGFFVRGWVADLKAEIKKAKIVLAPLQFGAGIKGKLTLAMSCGTPSITTSVGAEGMDCKTTWPGHIADTTDAFTRAAVNLYKNESSWLQAQNKGVDIINTIYSRIYLEKRLAKKINQIRENLHLHRSKNIVGSLLQHQTLNATKYMSKWIEAKSKK